MSEKRFPRFGGTISLKGSASDSSQKKLRRPPGLVLTEAKPASSTTTESSALSNCGICNKTVTVNPKLCEDCQIWNDTRHVFKCLREGEKWVTAPAPTLQDALDRKECLICQAIARAVLAKLKSYEVDNQAELSKIEILNMGPYCFGAEATNALNPEFLSRSGMYQMDPGDLRLSDAPSSHIRPTSAPEKLRIVVYLVLTAPPGSRLHEQIPELDSYKTFNDGPEFVSKGAELNFGSHREAQLDGALLQPTIGLQLDLTYSSQKRHLIGIEPWEQVYIDTSLLDNWLQHCISSHESKVNLSQKASCDLDTSQIPLPSGFRVIDTYRHCIVALPSSPLPRYAALSYTWGATSGIKELQLELANLDALEKEDALQRLGGIPDIIIDAMTLCADMNVQYLWVDRLCIIQDDPEVKMSQINAMDRIYHMAYFTIIAAVPLGTGLPGVRNRPRKPSLENHTRRYHPKLRFIADNFNSAVMSSFWNTRGWTFQERILSRRAIYVTEWQTYFLCNRGAEQEEIGGFAASVNPWGLHRFTTYAATLADYTARKLSFGSDILNAFAGIGNWFEASTQRPLLHGVPERHFSQALLWEQDGACWRREGVLSIPSWSWAAWEGRSKYELNARVEKLHIGTLVRFYIYEPNRGLRRIQADETWFWKLIDLDNLMRLPVIDPLYPEMKHMPDAEATEAAWRECVQNPWTVSTHGVEEHISTTGAEHLGMLVFRTTCAIVALQQPSTYDHVATPGYVKLDILAQDSATVIGQLAQLPLSWVKENIDMDSKHRIVVIAAGIASESVRYVQTHSFKHVDGSMQAPRMGDSVWYLHVMLIRDCSSGVSERMTIGTIEMRAWNGLGPEWCNVVLA